MNIFNNIFDACRRFGIDLPAEKKMDYCMVSSNSSLLGNDLIIIFNQKQKKPYLIIKKARIAEKNRALRNECEWIHLLKENALDMGVVPNIYFSSEWNGLTYFVQDAIDGVELGAVITHASLKESWIQSVMWKAIDFIAGHFNNGEKLNVGSQLHASALFAEHVKALSLSQKQKERVQQASDKIGLIPCSCHGDFWASNIIVDKKNKKLNAVLDYEFGSRFCYTFFDIIWFVVNLSIFVGGKSALAIPYEWERTFFSENSNGVIYRKVIEYYFSKIGHLIPPIFDLFVLSFVYASFREKNLFGHSVNMDKYCKEFLLVVLEQESEFIL